MSNAIVAKAINDSIGTQDFKGLNTILDEHLNKLDEILQRNANDIKDALTSIEALTNPIYSYKDGDGIIDVLTIETSTDGEYKKSKTIDLKYGGILKLSTNVDAEFTVGGTGIEFDWLPERNAMVVKFVPGASIFVESDYEFYMSVFVYGHTEYAPSY